MGETRVDLLRLLEDLRDAYPGSLEETILTETVANALDSGATAVAISADAAARTFTVVDDGRGMSRRALTRYHDLAVTSKRRGRSIGFAGVGIKLGLLVSEEVVTETRRARNPIATSWRLASRTRAPWRWTEPRGLLEAPGTAVRLYLDNALSQLLDPGFLEEGILRHFQPLLDPLFDDLLSAHYPSGVRFRINGRPVARVAPGAERVRLEVRVGRQRKPSGAGFLLREPFPDEEGHGLAVSTLGKVIRRGWEWLGLSPGPAEVGGLIEIPALAEALTLNKADFVRTGARGATFLAYRKAVQEAVAVQLEAWGEGPGPTPPRRRRTRSLERDLESVLADLSVEYPLLATLVERRPGGQRRLPLGGEPAPRSVTPGAGLEIEPGGLPTAAGPAGEPSSSAPPPEPAGEPERERTGEAAETGPRGRTGDLPAPALPGRRGRREPARFGLTLRFESRPEDPEIGRLMESTVWVNDAHPAYRRALASRSEGYHLALTVAMALASVAVEPVAARGFVTDFLARWGEAGRDGG